MPSVILSSFVDGNSDARGCPFGDAIGKTEALPVADGVGNRGGAYRRQTKGRPQLVALPGTSTGIVRPVQETHGAREYLVTVG